MNISRQFAEPNFMACSHVVGESNVLLRNTLARWNEFTQLSADDLNKVGSYGCEFTEIHDCCKELSTCTRRSDANSIMRCLSELQQCLDSVIGLLRSSHNAHQAPEHLSSVLSTVAHEGQLSCRGSQTHMQTILWLLKMFQAPSFGLSSVSQAVALTGSTDAHSATTSRPRA